MDWKRFQDNAIFRNPTKNKKRKRRRGRPDYDELENLKRELVLNKAADCVTQRLVEFKKSMHRKPTKAETEFKYILSECGLGKLFRCHQAVLFGYIVDFFSPRLLLGIEIDGGYHFTKEQQAYDDKRERILLKHGIKIIRFTNDMVLKQRESVKRSMIDSYGRFSRGKRPKEINNPKIYFAGEQTQEQLRALIPSENWVHSLCAEELSKIYKN